MCRVATLVAVFCDRGKGLMDNVHIIVNLNVTRDCLAVHHLIEHCAFVQTFRSIFDHCIRETAVRLDLRSSEVLGSEVLFLVQWGVF